MIKNKGGRKLSGDFRSTSLESPLISVLVVTYNAEKYLIECLESIFSQTYNNIELIVVDGNSSDKTKEIIESFDKKIDYWISEPDTGQSNAFNKGFKLCSGELLTWLNADEVYTPFAIESVATKFKENRNLNWFSAGIVVTDEKLNVKKMRKGEGGQNFLKKIGALNIYGSSSFFTKELFEKAGGMNEQLHYTMDTDLWWRFLNMGELFYRVPNYICLYRIHDNSKTGEYTLSNNIRKPDHQAEVDRIFSLYAHQPNGIFGKRSATVMRNTFRLFSFNYLSSVIDTIRHKGKNALDVFN